MNSNFLVALQIQGCTLVSVGLKVHETGAAHVQTSKFLPTNKVENPHKYINNMEIQLK
jgi:hypothetical protein